MKIFTNLNAIPNDLFPVVLSIGKFEGVHLGHLALLAQAKKCADDFHGKLYVLTFENHPIEVLNEGVHISKLYTNEQKLELLEMQHVDAVILLKFSQEFAKQTAEIFLRSLHKKIPFKALILGHDAKMGSDRQGNDLILQNLAQELHFQIHSIPPYYYENTVVSTSLIREMITQGNLDFVKKLLGRSYSLKINGLVKSSQKIILTYDSSLCLPPPGHYAVHLQCTADKFPLNILIKESNGVLEIELDCSDVGFLANGATIEQALRRNDSLTLCF